MIPFRIYHLIALLESYSFKTPFPEHVKKYFEAHHSLGKKDREEIKKDAFFFLKNCLKLEKGFNVTGWKEVVLKQKACEKPVSVSDRFSVSPELYDLISSELAENASQFLQTLQDKAPVTLRVNTRKITANKLIELLEPTIKIHKVDHEICTAPDDAPLTQTPEYQKGFFEIQDEASILACRLVHPARGERLLDMCAGSGGKSLGIATQASHPIHLTLHETRPRMLQEAKRRFLRNGLPLPHIFTVSEPFDWIVLDVPCSGSGTWRRHFEQTYLFSLETLSRLIEQQRKIFNEAIRMPCQHIVYMTCSVFPSENENQAAFFCEKYSLKKEEEFISLPLKPGDRDGFYAVRFSFS
ncbi:MAG: hypothetical protein A3F09_03430 [Chlamydiae bacterium RIFCSPHIGHO2_12_FULL_49_11]|nr:MAG: hypothetical protein A3F09_03430 [Chlamydiae bacterium RIFCSPHIGHO2_12_FULL_49_11]